MRVLVTGGAGFIGRQVVAALAGAGHEVIGTTRGDGVDIAAGRGTVAWERLDVQDRDARVDMLARVRPDVVVGVAWHTDPATVKNGDANLGWIATTVGLVDDAAAAGASRFVGVGSCFEYAFPTAVLNETTTPREGDTRYGRAKVAASHVAELACAQRDMSFAWTRPFYVLGPHENHRRVLPYVINSVLHGEVAETSHGRQVRDFMHVVDVGGAIAAVATNDVAGAVNVGLGSGISLAQLFTIAAEEAGDASLLHLGARPPGPAEAPEIIADVARLRDEVGFVPRFGDRRAAIADTVAWWRANPPAPV